MSAWPARGGEGRVRLVFDAESAEILAPELEFLVRRGVPETMLREALRRAALNGTAATQELFALGFDKRHYWSMLADDLGLVFLEDLSGATPLANAGMLATEAVRIASSALARIEDATILLLAPRPAEILVLRRRLQATPALSARLRIATPDAIRGLIATRRHQALTHYAVNRLARALPQLSSGCERPAGISGHKALVAAARRARPRRAARDARRDLAPLHALLPELQLLEARGGLPPDTRRFASSPSPTGAFRATACSSRSIAKRRWSPNSWIIFRVSTTRRPRSKFS